uniref:Glycosyltransferase family 92 protein n=1 Tax=Ditylenchus dipsaci TaxID=166011 RepID=A0A915DBS7_9BILA
MRKVKHHYQRKIVYGSVEHVRAIGNCRAEVFILKCIFESESQKPVSDSTIAATSYFIGFNQNLLISSRAKINKAMAIPITPEVPDRQPRDIVICMSRIFAFERWQLLVTAMEVYKLLKVDLVVAHVISALDSIYQLMKVYEEQKILLIKPGVEFPYTQDMAYDSNMQTEFNSQILLAHECFYQFRESAQFIALIDWDDLLITLKFKSLFSAFQAATLRFPQAAYYSVNKLESSFIEQEKDPSKFNLRALMTQGIKTAHIYNDEKMVVRPSKLRGFWMHNSVYLEEEAHPVQLTTNYSIMLHLANEERVPQQEFLYSFLSKLDLDTLERTSRHLLSQLQRKQVIDQLPTEYPYFESISQCHKNIFVYYKANTEPMCLSYSLCAFPKSKTKCMVTHTKWYSKQLNDGWNTIHVRVNSTLNENFNGCIKDRF